MTATDPYPRLMRPFTPHSDDARSGAPDGTWSGYTGPPLAPLATAAPVGPAPRTIRWGCGDIGYGLLLMLVLSIALGIPAVLLQVAVSGASLSDPAAIDVNAPIIVFSGLLGTWLGLGGW